MRESTSCRWCSAIALVLRSLLAPTLSGQARHHRHFARCGVEAVSTVHHDQAARTGGGVVDLAHALLTNREHEIVDGLVAGHPNKIIAFDLKISPRTVEIYRANVMTKMKAASLSELVRMALGAGIIKSQSDD
jgi:DNA-binding NarL/FixJ family response regulator